MATAAITKDKAFTIPVVNEVVQPTKKSQQLLSFKVSIRKWVAWLLEI
jgi:hypothetical protein